MNTVGKLGSYISKGVYTVSGPFHPFGGAIDIIVVEQPDGSFKSSSWYVRFGKFQGVLRAKENLVDINVNGVNATFHMYLDHRGEAYFLREVEDEGAESIFLSSSSSSSDETDVKSFKAIPSRKPESSEFSGLRSVDEGDVKKMERTISRRSKLMRFVFGPRSKSEGNNLQEVDKCSASPFISPVERAEIAADLLDLKWSTNLATSRSKRGSIQKLDGSSQSSTNFRMDYSSTDSANSIVKNRSDKGAKSGNFENPENSKLHHSTSEGNFRYEGHMIEVPEEKFSPSGDSLMSSQLPQEEKKVVDVTLVWENVKLDSSLTDESHILASCRICHVSSYDLLDNHSDKITFVNHMHRNRLQPSLIEGSVKDLQKAEIIHKTLESNLRSDDDQLLSSSELEPNLVEHKSEVTNGHGVSGIVEASFASSDCVPLTRSRPQQECETYTKSIEMNATFLCNDVGENRRVAESEGQYLKELMPNRLTNIALPEKNLDKPINLILDGRDKENLLSCTTRDSVSINGNMMISCNSTSVHTRSYDSARGSNSQPKTSTPERSSNPVGASDAENNEVLPNLTKRKARVIIPTSEELKSLNLRDGKNTVTFTFSTPVLGKQEVEARIFLWKWNTRIVISDVDGTITKSDVLGQFMPLLGADWSQTGVANLFSAIKSNGYQFMFLSARAISQAYHTRKFLFNINQNGQTLPDGPVMISPDGLFPSLFREIIRRAPHEFKIACLQDIKALFPSDCHPFYAGFGNRDTDEISYLKVGVPKGKIFIINPKGQVAVNRCVDTKSYHSLHDLVHGMFPSMVSSEQEDYNSWNFWKLPLPLVDL